MTKKEFVKCLSDATGLGSSEILKVLDAQQDAVLKELAATQRVEIPGLAIFSLRSKKARKAAMRKLPSGVTKKIPAAPVRYAIKIKPRSAVVEAVAAMKPPK